MTDEEKAEEYLKQNKICNNENWEVGGFCDCVIAWCEIPKFEEM